MFRQNLRFSIHLRMSPQRLIRTLQEIPSDMAGTGGGEMDVQLFHVYIIQYFQTKTMSLIDDMSTIYMYSTVHIVHTIETSDASPLFYHFCVQQFMKLFHFLVLFLSSLRSSSISWIPILTVGGKYCK